MPIYTRAWDETVDGSTVAADSIDAELDKIRVDLRERIGGIFGLNAAEFAADPIVPKSLTVSDDITADNFIGSASEAKRARFSGAQELGVPAGNGTTPIALPGVGTSWTYHVKTSAGKFLVAHFCYFGGITSQLIQQASHADISASLFNGQLFFFNNSGGLVDIIWTCYQVF